MITITLSGKENATVYWILIISGNIAGTDCADFIMLFEQKLLRLVCHLKAGISGYWRNSHSFPIGKYTELFRHPGIYSLHLYLMRIQKKGVDRQCHLTTIFGLITINGINLQSQPTYRKYI